MGNTTTDELQQQYRDFVDAQHRLGLGVFEYNSQGDTLQAYQDQFLNYRDLGSCREPVALEEVIRSHPELDALNLRKGIELGESSGESFTFETVLKRNDESTGWVQLNLFPFEAEEGRRIIILMKDTSRRHPVFGSDNPACNPIPTGFHRCYISDPVHLEYASASLAHLLGYTEEEFNKLVGNVYVRAVVKEDWVKMARAFSVLSQEEGSATVTYRMIARDGHIVNVSDTMESLRAEDGTMYGYSMVTNLDEVRHQQEESAHQLQEARRHLEEADREHRLDYLTKLCNRQELSDQLEKAREGETDLRAVYMVDIDDFKRFNDTLGHPAGDECLVRIGRALRSYGEQHHLTAFRYGGEEFVLLLRGGTEDPGEIADALVELIRDLQIERGDAGIVTVSVGYTIPGGEEEPAGWIRQADKAMYRAKRAGKNRACAFEGRA